MTRWRKTGVVIHPPVDLPWAASHAALPFAHPCDDESVWVYFTARDAKGRSNVARARLWLDPAGAPGEVQVDPEPVVRPGTRGGFDDSGAMMSCLVAEGGREWLYYQGWALGVTVPFYVFIGCATREDAAGPFTRVSPAPVLGPHATDPIMCASAWVIVDEGHWRMWYGSNRAWVDEPDGSAEYRVQIRYAESRDGIEWQRDGHVCLDLSEPGETTLTRPSVIRDPDRYRMWFSHRGESYRIGYAESADGLEWERRDDLVGIDVSESGFDSDMVEYGCVFDHGGRRHMLYNGNGFGATGVGHALLED